ncbi:MAG TPA: PIN domain-containing protein [Candidatus Micrarchaeia archaeon]|nr:PIN domain-containing protein [Candidatus Micrarchaeia archaeon]
MNVFDASALLAFLQGEHGAAAVEDGLHAGGACGTATWSEVAQKVRAHGRDWGLARALLGSYGLRLEPVTVADAEQAAVHGAAGSGLSLADRLCIALGHRLHATVWTADSRWGSSEIIRQIR